MEGHGGANAVTVVPGSPVAVRREVRGRRAAGEVRGRREAGEVRGRRAAGEVRGRREIRLRRRARERRQARRGVAVRSLELACIAYLASVGGLLWWSNAPMLVGWQPRVVLTGSMLPAVRPGDVALIGPADAGDPLAVPPGRIVLVDDPVRDSGSYLHRVVRYEADGRLVTRGDANASEDHPAVGPDQVAGQLRLLVPAIGRPVVWIHERNYLALGSSLAGTWAALALVLSLRGRRAGRGGRDRGRVTNGSRDVRIRAAHREACR